MVERAIEYVRERRDAQLEWTRELCRIPSISTDPAHAQDVRAAVEWTRDLCERIGFMARVFDTDRHPLCYAEWTGKPGAATYLVYGHVDVQPTGDRSLWDADPFEPVVKDEWLICRGSADDKGQVLAHLRAAAAWLGTAGELPVNLKFLIEGEEEIASPNLGPFLEQHAEMLGCDGVLISDTGLYADGLPTITLGTRGMVYKEVRVRGPKHDLHSGHYGGAVGNPANVLARLLAELHDAAGRVSIPGFYDNIEAISEQQRARLAELPFDAAAVANELGVPRLSPGEVGPDGEPLYSPDEQRSIRPTLDCNGIFGGFQGEGANTIIPAWAGAKISMRLVPDQDAQRVSRLFDEAVRDRCPDTVRLEVTSHGPAVDAYVTPPDSAMLKAAQSALQAAFDKQPVLVREGGSLPILPLFQQVLGADSLLIGFASPSCNAHGPNEKIYLPDLDRGVETLVRLYGAL